MPNYEVIAAVSETLRKVLKTAMNDADLHVDVELDDLQFEAPFSNPTLTIFLFEIGEDPSARNRPRVRETNAANFSIRKPPVALVLRYLLTAWRGQEAADQQTPQKILGQAIHVLYNKAVLSGPDLQGVLIGTDEALKVTMSPLSLEDRTRVFNAVQKPYRLSVSYEVRVVNLDSEAGSEFKPVARRSVSLDELEASS
jgi:Pvc16 N-terminal domain